MWGQWRVSATYPNIGSPAKTYVKTRGLTKRRFRTMFSKQFKVSVRSLFEESFRFNYIRTAKLKFLSLFLFLFRIGKNKTISKQTIHFLFLSQNVLFIFLSRCSMLGEVKALKQKLRTTEVPPLMLGQTNLSYETKTNKNLKSDTSARIP